MLKRVVCFLAFASLIISFGGCATCDKEKDFQIQGLKNQVSALETQAQQRDTKVDDLQGAGKTQAETKPDAIQEKIVVGAVKSRPNTKHIQTALKNAGYYSGRIDGKMGKQTIGAIKDFQKANNLPADGRVGKKTWNSLKEYLYKKAK